MSKAEKNISEGIECLQKDKISEALIKNFSSVFKNCCTEFKEIYSSIEEFILDSSNTDEVVKLIIIALDDFSAYHLLYMAIRTGCWKKRTTSLRIMLERIVVSGATFYQKLIIKHLADIGSGYDKETLEFLEVGWVSSLSDGNANYLSEDEFHERTASKDIKLIIPKFFSETNIEAISHVITINAKQRCNFIEEILGIEPREHFLTQGCTPNFLKLNEKHIVAFQEKFKELELFTKSDRKLIQPFTNIEVPESVRNNMLNGRKIGRDAVEAYVLPRFCATPHNMSK